MLFSVALCCFCCFLLLFAACCCFLLLLAAFCCFLLPFAAFCCFLLLFVAFWCFLLLFCYFLVFLLPFAAVCCFLQPSSTDSRGDFCQKLLHLSTQVCRACMRHACRHLSSTSGPNRQILVVIPARICTQICRSCRQPGRQAPLQHQADTRQAPFQHLGPKIVRF